MVAARKGMTSLLIFFPNKVAWATLLKGAAKLLAKPRAGFELFAKYCPPNYTFALLGLRPTFKLVTHNS